MKWKYNLKNVNEENKVYKKAKFLYKNWDFNKLSKILDRQNWEEKYTEKTVQACCSDFLNVYKKACELCIPKIDALWKRKTNFKWLNRGIKSNMRKKLNLWYRKMSLKWENS